MKNILWLNLLLCVLFIGCSKEEIDDDFEQKGKSKFIEQTVSGVYSGETSLLVYQEDMHQIAYTDDRKSWRIQNDNMSVYVSYVLNETAVQDKEVSVIIKTKGVEGLKEGEQKALPLKMENGKCWLWLLESGIGILSETK